MSAGDASFLRSARLTTKSDYGRVFAEPRKLSDRYFTVLARARSSAHPPAARLGLAVSKKVSRSAVARNRIKRLIRESFRQQHQQLGAVDIVVIARSGAAAQQSSTLHDALSKHWSRLKQQCAAH